MSCDDCTIHLEGLAKRYEVYAQPIDRLKQMTLPKLRRWMHRSERDYFKEFWALRDVGFDVHRGETVGIVGRNGSGKSTLLQIICGTLTPTVGTVDVRGRIAALLELGSGFNPEFTGRENAYLNATVLGLSRSEVDARFADIEAFADIGEFIDQPVKTYSSGMYVRLAFAVAINVDPEILVVDEALSVGDEAFQRKCFARIEQIREKGATILFVSHAAGTVIDICDRAILMDSGEMLAEGTPKFIISRYHKLLFASQSRATAIREAIRQEFAARTAVSDGVELAGSPAMDSLVLAEVDESSYDEGLVPQSTVHYESRGAVIDDPHIETIHGRRVNVLKSGGEYVYTYAVRFSEAAYGMRFGMLIRTTTGVPLGGAVSAANPGEGIAVAAGQVFAVKFRFRALLAPGAFFLNAGVTAIGPDGEYYLYRIVDAAMFRIMPDSAMLMTGTVDFGADSTYECMTEQVS